MNGETKPMQIQRVEALPASLKKADFSFEIDGEAAPPFDGPGVARVVSVPGRLKAYGLSEAFFEPASKEERLLITAIDGDDVAGYLCASPGWNGCVLIDDLAVEHRFRRRGIGKMLMDEAVAWAGRSGVRAIRLETQSTNVAACRFYERYGFVLGGYDKHLYSQLGADVRNEVALFWYFFLKSQ